MLRQIYYCDWCQIEIGERCKNMFHHVYYDDLQGNDIHTDYHFCSKMCMKHKVKQLKVETSNKVGE